jgi:hypothetical protein
MIKLRHFVSGVRGTYIAILAILGRRKGKKNRKSDD